MKLFHIINNIMPEGVRTRSIYDVMMLVRLLE